MQTPFEHMQSTAGKLVFSDRTHFGCKRSSFSRGCGGHWFVVLASEPGDFADFNKRFLLLFLVVNVFNWAIAGPTILLSALVYWYFEFDPRPKALWNFRVLSWVPAFSLVGYKRILRSQRAKYQLLMHPSLMRYTPFSQMYWWRSHFFCFASVN